MTLTWNSGPPLSAHFLTTAAGAPMAGTPLEALGVDPSRMMTIGHGSDPVPAYNGPDLNLA